MLAIPPNYNLPYQFTVEVTENGNGVIFVISKLEKTGNAPKTITCRLNRTQHASYLDMFEQLHAHLGLRSPQNRKSHNKPICNADYRELLIVNLDDGMRYGYGDPAILLTTNGDRPCYYLVSTSNDAPDSFPIIKSGNLTDWEFVGYVFPKGNKPDWSASGEHISDYWAPEMHKVGNEYRVYFVARDKDSRELCIGLARSKSPGGPFIAESKPLLTGNVIDPHIFVEDANSSYLFWKEDNNDVWPGTLIDLLAKNPGLITQMFTSEEDRATASFIITLQLWLQTLNSMERFLFAQVFIEAVTSKFTIIYNLLNTFAATYPGIAEEVKQVMKFMKTPVFASQLSADGTHLKGEKTKVIENDLDWEAHLVEGMWVTKQQDKYYLFYAGNDFSTDQYGIGVAISNALLGPYHKLSAPILSSTEQWLAPGHPSVTTAPDGKPIMVFHAYFPGHAGYKQFRALLAVSLNFSSANVSVG